MKQQSVQSYCILPSPSRRSSSKDTMLDRFTHSLARRLMVRQPTLTKGFLVLLMLGSSSLLLLSYYVASSSKSENAIPQEIIRCQLDSKFRDSVNDHVNVANQLRIDNKVLIIAETQYTSLGQGLVTILEANRIKFKLALAGKSLPSLTHLDKGRFGVVVFERLESYLNMDVWNRQLLDKYCQKYHVGIIAFAHPDEALYNAQVKDFPLFVHTKLSLHSYELNPSSPILRVTRAGDIVRDTLPGEEWTVFVGNHSTYEPLSWAKMKSSKELEFSNNEIDEIIYVPVIRDRGTFDGVQRVFFGSGFDFWLHRLLFLDALSYFSNGKFSITLDRYIMVDIDDIFVGRPLTRMTKADVEATVQAQKRMRQIVKDFTFNLGFSGKYFRHGTESENEGDDALIENKHEFWWFGHSWSHTQAHTFINLSAIMDDMLLNKAFAKLYELPVNTSYVVAPHHSGVYPVHEDLYDAWNQVWNIRVTSTEEYPHLRPARHRRGFVHKNIMVLPRQTCGLFTHTIFFNEFPGGRKKLDNSISGGELFQTILFNKVSIFMTHLSNYGNDRLGLYTFENVFKFLQCWTNLRLHTVPPLKLAEIYFSTYPDEVDAVWRNPCDDHRHLEIWSEQKSCDRLPDFLVIGPQKTGTTALYTYLAMNPSFVSNFNNPTTFEEVQFFSGKNYQKGLDWYMEQFPLLENTTGSLLFEKSANYFNSDKVPERAHALLPHAKIICILINPAKRAYSWYQHMRAHKDPVAMKYSFYEVISGNSSSPDQVQELRRRCLSPGLFAQHIERWLNYYDSGQFLIIDGDVLKNSPVQVMEKVQNFLEVETQLNYSKLIKYDVHKGFFCQVTGNRTKCLGPGKGRKYEPMDFKSEELLRTFFRKPNVALNKLLLRLELRIPDWLEEELSDDTR